MSGTAPYLADWQEASDAAVKQIAANENSRRSAGPSWRDVADQTLSARHRHDFAAAEHSLQLALTRADRDLGAAGNAVSRKAARERRADICRALAESRLEWLDLAGAAQYYRNAIESFPRDLAKERCRGARGAGNALRQFALLTGSDVAAQQAVGFLREAVSLVPGQGDVQNELGLACVTRGELSWSNEAFEEARAAYGAALAAADEVQRGAEAFRCRVEINQAVALRRLAALNDESAPQLQAEADTRLRRAIHALRGQSGPMIRVDLPRAWDNLGGLLYDQGKWDAAIAAYETARDGWADDEERARTLHNLALTYGKAERFNDALKAFEEALGVAERASGTLLEVTRPMAWSRAQQYRGEVLRLYGESLRGVAPERSRDYLEQALEVLRSALRQRKLDRAPMLWAETTATTAMVLQQLGQLDGAVALYLQALPHLNHKDRPDTILSLMQVFLNNESLVLYLDMASKRDLLADIRSVLEAHGVEREDWGATWAEIGRRLQVGAPSSAYASPQGAAAAVPRLVHVEPESAQAPSPAIPHHTTAEGLIPENDNTPLGRLQLRYQQRLAALALPEGGFKTREQANAAGRLSKTLQDLQHLQARLGLKVTEKPPNVREAERMRMAFLRRYPAKPDASRPPRTPRSRGPTAP